MTALLAIETTNLQMRIPGLADGSRIHVAVWDTEKRKKADETVTYHAPFTWRLDKYDFILINKTD